MTEISKWEERIFAAHDATPGIELRLADQFQLLNQVGAYHAEQPFRDEKDGGRAITFGTPYSPMLTES